MATKLRNLNIKKVDFVDEGANPDAHITLYKRREAGKGENDQMNWLERVGKVFADVLGLEGPEDIEKAVQLTTVKKAKRTARVFDEVWWGYSDALRKSITSIIEDDDLDEAEKTEMFTKTLGEFSDTVHKSLTDTPIQIALEEKIDKNRTDHKAILVKMRDELTTIIEKADDEDEEYDEDEDDEDDDGVEDEDDETTDGPEADAEGAEEGDEDEMKVDKSKMTPGELAVFEEMEKKYGVKAEESVEKNIHPEVAAELESLKKFKDETEMREMVSFAKRFEIIGKKPDELAKKLIDLKKSGAFDDYVAVLDEQLGLVEKSGLFSEVGKRGSEGGDPWSMIEKAAGEIMKSENVGYHEAIDKACNQNPDLVVEYEKSRQ